MKKRVLTMVLSALVATQVLTGCSLGKAQQGGEVAEGTLQLGVCARGYGDEYLKQLAKAYEEKTGVKTVLVKSIADGSALRAGIQAGEKNNDIDIFFDIWPTAMSALATANYVEGYERAFLPISDVYDKVPEGYGDNKTVEELMMPYAIKASTWGGAEAGYGDGEQYFVCYATGMEGLMYNVSLFEKYKLTVPKTTNEFFALMEKMKTLEKGSYAKNEEGYDIYPYIYSGKANYSNYLATAWWAQYDGIDNFNLALEGKDASGQYTANSVKAVGRLSAMTVVSKLLNQKNAYVDSSNYSTSFTDVQLKFLDNQAFMMSTGDWVEREMEANFTGESLNIAFMRIPVNSDIILNCDSITTEAQLVETIAYIDGETTTRPSYLSDADLARIKEARSVYCSEGNQHIAYIPVYSDMAEEAKDFLLFMLSKEGQEIMTEFCYGNMAPMDVDVTQFRTYDSLSSLQLSKYEMLVSDVGLGLVGNNYSHPMAYAGGVQTFYNVPNFESAFGVVETSSSFMTPEQLWQADYERMANNWNLYMTRAGVAN